MPDDEWIKTLGDGRRVKFTNQELEDRAFVTAQIEGNKVVYSIVLTHVETLLVVTKLKVILKASFRRSSRTQMCAGGQTALAHPQ